MTTLSDLPEGVAAAVSLALTYTRDEREIHTRRMEALRGAACLLRAHRVPGPDAARILGVSKSRFYQFTEADGG